jgi:hypothetical protein
LAEDAPGIVAHRNADHVEAMILLAGSHAGIQAIEATMTSVDRLGFTLRLKTVPNNCSQGNSDRLWDVQNHSSEYVECKFRYWSNGKVVISEQTLAPGGEATKENACAYLISFFSKETLPLSEL